MRHILCAILGALSLSHAHANCAGDSWLHADKLAHASGSAALSAGVAWATDSPTLGVISALAVGAAKEAYDARHPKQCASFKDFGADVAGAIAGAHLARIYLIPQPKGVLIAYSRSF